MNVSATIFGNVFTLNILDSFLVVIESYVKFKRFDIELSASTIE